jgi:flagellar biogenesis protein FliO
VGLHKAKFALLLAALHVHSFVLAQETPATRALTQGDDVLEFPSIGRVIFAFVLAAALAFGVAFALRRILPKFGKALPGSSRLKVLDRLHLNNSLRVHLVEVENERVLVAENRSAITMVVLQSARPDSTPKA